MNFGALPFGPLEPFFLQSHWCSTSVCCGSDQSQHPPWIQDGEPVSAGSPTRWPFTPLPVGCHPFHWGLAVKSWVEKAKMGVGGFMVLGKSGKPVNLQKVAPPTFKLLCSPKFPCRVAGGGGPSAALLKWAILPSFTPSHLEEDIFSKAFNHRSQGEAAHL